MVSTPWKIWVKMGENAKKYLSCHHHLVFQSFMIATKFLLGQLPHRFRNPPVFFRTRLSDQRGGMTTSKAKKPPTKGLPGGPSNKTRQKLISSSDEMRINRKIFGSNTKCLGTKNDPKWFEISDFRIKTLWQQISGRFIWCNIKSFDQSLQCRLSGKEQHSRVRKAFRSNECVVWHDFSYFIPVSWTMLRSILALGQVLKNPSFVLR